MLTKAQIAAAPNTLDAIDIAMLVTILRKSVSYRSSPEFYPELEDAITATIGTVKAQQLNAIMDLIEALGPGEVAISGGDEGLRYSQTAEREAMLNYALSVLYDRTVAVEQSASAARAYGVGQRDLTDEQLDSLL